LKRSAQQAVIRVADAIAMGKTQVIDLDLKVKARATTFEQSTEAVRAVGD
jgi:hypothetical protein